MIRRLLNEPTRIASAIRAVILAVGAFGFELTPAQLGALMLAVEAVLMEANRALVTPNQLAEARVDAGLRPTQKMNT